jgi:hypothetical protein
MKAPVKVVVKKSVAARRALVAKTNPVRKVPKAAARKVSKASNPRGARTAKPRTAARRSASKGKATVRR